jgi:hypothetical protein
VRIVVGGTLADQDGRRHHSGAQDDQGEDEEESAASPAAGRVLGWREQCRRTAGLWRQGWAGLVRGGGPLADVLGVTGGCCLGGLAGGCGRAADFCRFTWLAGWRNGQGRLIGGDELGEGGRPERHRRACRVCRALGRDGVHQRIQRGAARGVPGKAVCNQAAQRCGEAVQGGLVVHDPVDHGGCLAIAERADASGSVGEHTPEGEHVASRPGALAVGLLGGHEPGCADGQPGPGQRGALKRQGDPEIDQSRSIGRQQHVRGLEITVD